MSKITNSEQLYQRACKVMVGGVNSPVRSFKSIGGKPVFISHGKGSKLYDVDGNYYIDYVLSFGALIHGHSNDAIVSNIIKQLIKGTNFSAPTEPELLLAEEICNTYKSIEKVRLVNSGTEATMSAIRVARAYTKKKYIVKFNGCYHGHSDQFLVRAGSGAATHGIPNSAGVPEEIASLTITCEYNDVKTLREIFDVYGDDIAAVIVEPVAGNMGVVPARKEFLEEIIRLCNKNNSISIFDEVITGYRLSREGAQGIYNLKPDLTCLGKIIGGGFPIGAYGGREDLMNLVSPLGPVYQAGTLSGNPVACAAGLATISLLNDDSYKYLEKISSKLHEEMEKIAKENSINICINRMGSMLSLFFTNRKVECFQDVLTSDLKMFSYIHQELFKRNVYLPPSQFEAWFLSTAHTEEDIDKTIDAFSIAIKNLKK